LFISHFFCKIFEGAWGNGETPRVSSSTFPLKTSEKGGSCFIEFAQNYITAFQFGVGLVGGNSNIFKIFTANLGEMIQFDEQPILLQLGWGTNHKVLVNFSHLLQVSV